MNRQAASFAMGIPGEDETEDESDLVGQEVATAAVSFEDGAPECIFCREKSGDVMGYLAFLQTSSTIKRAVQRHSDCKEMESVYRVVALSGANVTFSAAESSKLVGHVGHGEHVLVGSRSGRWMRVVSPIAGWIPLYQRLPLLPKSTEWPTPARSAALQLPERNQRLLNTYEGPQTPGKAALEVILHPVADRKSVV